MTPTVPFRLWCVLASVASTCAAVTHDVILDTVLVAGTRPIGVRRPAATHTGYSAVRHDSKFVVGVTCAPVHLPELNPASWCDIDFYGRFTNREPASDNCSRPRYTHSGFSGSDRMYAYTQWRRGVGPPVQVFTTESHSPLTVGCTVGEKWPHRADWVETLSANSCQFLLDEDSVAERNVTCSIQSPTAAEYHAGSWTGLELTVRSL